MQASRIVVVVVIVVIIGAFAAILWKSIASMGGYPLGFDTNKSRTEAAARMRGTPGSDSAVAPVTPAQPDPEAPASTEAPAYTLRYCDADGTHATPPEPMPAAIALLVHGLDDPGWTWNEVITALVESGEPVARFDYPNDQGIARSAAMLAEAVNSLHTLGVERITIIAHSMGGLVARDLLTRPEYYAGDGSGGGGRPAIDRLIMLGTPNHGSQLARLRGVSEIGEQLSRAWSGESELFGFLEDGEGQAGFDLIPSSDFLTELNARPLATHTKYTIVAGRASPVDAGEIGDLVDTLDAMIDRDKLPKWVRDRLDAADADAIKSSLGSLVEGAGDGAVSLDSTRLRGIEDHVIVEADHVSMIIDFLNLDRTPPAIPIILDRLRQDREARPDETVEMDI